MPVGHWEELYPETTIAELLPPSPPSGTLNAEVRYEIVSGDPFGNFTIHPIQGVISPTRPLDFEFIEQQGDIRFFNLTVRVR